MKKSFTLLESVFVIVVIGIIAAVIIPRINSNNLHEAAEQVISHIRYTQHLAMMDDKFDSSDATWYQKRWRIRFKKDLVYSALSPAGSYAGEWSYTIYSDTNGDGNPNTVEMANNPLNTSQYLSGGYNDTLHIDDASSMKKMRLGSSYGINEISFSGGCRSNILYINFDHLGRPFNSMNTSSAYELASSGWHKLLTSNCNISLCEGTCTGIASDTEIVLSIHPETGYVCSLDSVGNCI